MLDQPSPYGTRPPSVQLVTDEHLHGLVESGEIDTVLVAVPDMLGRLAGKDLDARHFLSHLPAGPHMCAYVLASDVDMTPMDGFDLTGWHNGYGDLHSVPDLETVRRLSYLPGTVLVHADAAHPDGRPVDSAPRRMLRNQIEALGEQHDLFLQVGIEGEFMAYKGTAAQVREAGYQDLTPAWPHNLDYALSRPPALNAFFRDLRHALHQAGAPVEAIKTEGTPGQVEVTWPYGDPVPACDIYTLYKHAVRHIADEHRMAPTFMASPETGIASGMHLHISLVNGDGEPVFAMAPDGELPDVLQQSIAGLLSALPQLAPLYAPTPNSYKRYAPHSFAPINYTWGIDNRTCAVRVVGRDENTHLEVRLPGADANPYLALSAVTAAIIHGITDHPKLPEPCTGDAYHETRRLLVPRNLAEALADFAGGIALRAFGAPLVRHYAHAAAAEINAQHNQVTDIERERGFLRA
ncbi:glutamine synthetase family protein [Streptomyces sp. NPDC088747]|uniref:glutamine synthetase family protein n=1 Tax=Streptomyces sp. NPDC088747 TaxID=3365886 RepID=UPI0037FA7167